MNNNTQLIIEQANHLSSRKLKHEFQSTTSMAGRTNCDQ